MAAAIEMDANVEMDANADMKMAAAIEKARQSRAYAKQDTMAASMDEKGNIDFNGLQSTTLEGTSMSKCAWGPRTQGRIAGHDIKVIHDVLVNDCKSACEENDECKSIEFQVG